MLKRSKTKVYRMIYLLCSMWSLQNEPFECCKTTMFIWALMNSIDLSAARFQFQWHWTEKLKKSQSIFPNEKISFRINLNTIIKASFWCSPLFWRGIERLRKIPHDWLKCFLFDQKIYGFHDFLRLLTSNPRVKYLNQIQKIKWDTESDVCICVCNICTKTYT